MKHEWSLPNALGMAYGALKRELENGETFHNTKENMEGALKRLEWELQQRSKPRRKKQLPTGS